jgi:hypothetical protein
MESENKKRFKITDWEKLSIKVILLFITAMLVSFSPEFLRGFFGDEIYEDGYTRGIIDDHWDWGFRHFLYFLMCIVLFIIQAVKIIKWVIERSDDRDAFEINK